MLSHAYVAGLIDGDGYVGIEHMKKADTYAVRVAVALVDKSAPVLHGLRRSYGGQIGPIKPETPMQRPKLRWTVLGIQAASALELVRPHLVLKPEQADICLALQKLIEEGKAARGRYHWTAASREEARILKARIHDLNLRGPEPKQGPTPLKAAVAVRRWGAWWEPQDSLFGPEPFDGRFPTTGSMINGVVYAGLLPAEQAPPLAKSVLPALFPTPRTSDANGGGSMVTEDSTSGQPSQLFRTPTAQLAVNGGSQHPDKRKRGGHGPTLADEVEHLIP